MPHLADKRPWHCMHTDHEGLVPQFDDGSAEVFCDLHLMEAPKIAERARIHSNTRKAAGKLFSAS